MPSGCNSHKKTGVHANSCLFSAWPENYFLGFWAGGASGALTGAGTGLSAAFFFFGNFFGFLSPMVITPYKS
jgi:hypothetical protein